jgi:hypothetical protein
MQVIRRRRRTREGCHFAAHTQRSAADAWFVRNYAAVSNNVHKSFVRKRFSNVDSVALRVDLSEAKPIEFQ